MVKLKKNVIKNELKYKNTVILTYEIEYPQIFSNNYNTERFNRLNLNKALELEKYSEETLFNDAKELYDYNVSHGYPIMVYEVILKTNITYNNAPIISLYQDEYIFSGGAHGSTVRSSQNWNLERNMQFTLNAVFGNNPNYILYVLRNINAQIEKIGPEYYFENYCSLVLENFNVRQSYLTPGYVNVYFQQYDIAPYSTGIPTFEIRYF